MWCKYLKKTTISLKYDKQTITVLQCNENEWQSKRKETDLCLMIAIQTKSTKSLNGNETKTTQNKTKNKLMENRLTVQTTKLYWRD